MHWRMFHWACRGCVKFKYSPYPKYTSSSSAHSSAPAQTRSQCHCTLLFAQVRAVLNPAPFPLAGQGAKDGGGRREGAVAVVPSPSLDGCLCTPVAVDRARCFRSLQSALPARGSEFPTPALCLIHVLAAVTEEKCYLPPPPPRFRTSLARCIWVVWSC